MVLVILAACAPDPARAGAGARAAAEPPGSVAPPDTGAPAAEPGPGCTPARPAGGLAPGDALRRVTFADSPARCNDGSPPVAYVRAGDPRQVVVHLRGGAWCDDPATCRDRWCGRGAYDAGNMSSAWAPPGLRANGLAAPPPGSPLAGFTVVELHYCSSDGWLGQAPAVDLDGWTIGFEGAGIVDHVVDALLEGVASDDGAEVLAPLRDARTVVWAGSSAGAFGAAFHLEAVADRLPEARVVGALDAMVSLDPDAIEPALRGDVVAIQRAIEDAPWEARTPAGCAVGCFDFTRWAAERRTRPVAWQHDLADPVVSAVFVPPLSIDAFADASVDALRTVAAQPGVGVLGPRCGEHMVLGGPAAWRRRVVDAEAGGAPLSFLEVLGSVLEGHPRSAIDDGSGRFSRCAP